MLPEKIPQLDVSISDQPGAGQLLKASNYEFRYVKADKDQLPVALLMPAARQLTWTDGDLLSPKHFGPYSPSQHLLRSSSPTSRLCWSR